VRTRLATITAITITAIALSALPATAHPQPNPWDGTAGQMDDDQKPVFVDLDVPQLITLDAPLLESDDSPTDIL
jgi:hypothetical protein